MIKSELINSKIFDRNGERDFIDFDRDNNNIIKNNIIIHGENLCTLELLKKEFKNKVKVIYIDPPYNTRGLNFTYKNKFDHKEWISFMKKRLLMAKDLLMDNGFLVIAIDHHELFYLGVLADEIFGRYNRLGVITVIHKPEGRNQEKFFGTSNEFMLVYTKDKNLAHFNAVVLSEEIIKKFNYQDDRGSYRLNPFINKNHGQGGIDTSTRENRPSFWYPIYVSKDLKNITLEKHSDYYEIFPITDSGQERTWRIKPETFLERLNNNLFISQKNGNKIKIFEKYYENQVVKTHWIEKKYNAINYGTVLLEKILGYKPDFSYPKSLYLIIDVLKLTTNKNDIILDFFAGSGTTGHAVLSLNKEDGGNRQFILIEQLKEHIDICRERICKVIKNEDLNTSFVFFKKKS